MSERDDDRDQQEWSEKPSASSHGSSFHGSTSTEPTSQIFVPSWLPSRGRFTPRWSVPGHALFRPPSMAGLPALGTMVFVGPPCEPSVPSLGFLLFLSCGLLKWQDASSEMFPPPELTVPPVQFAEELRATMLFV